MRKFLPGLASLGIVLGAFLLFGTKLTYAFTLSQGTIKYYTGYTPTFARSATPFTTGVTTQTNNADGSVTVSIIRADGYADSGFVFYDGKLGDLSDFTLTGTGDEYGLNLWFDVNSDGEYFNWTADVLSGLGTDKYILGQGSSGGVMNITNASAFTSMQPGGGNYTLAQLKAGDAAGITSDTPVAIWIGVCCGGTKSATINFPAPPPAPTPLTCTGDQHLDASGQNCVSFSQAGPPPAPPYTPSQGQVLGASTSTGRVLGASTLAGTGSFEENLYLAIMAIGGLITATGAKVFKKISVGK